MLHRLKLRVLYGHLLMDRAARRLKMRIILLSGFAVFPPFLLITYLVFFETRVIFLTMIGLLSSLVCIPVGLYAYAKGFGRPLREIWRERPDEMKWFSLKIGFLYSFALYWMILGIVEFLFGYQAFRAALISFVASAVARDGFEIGYLRARQEKGQRTIFPDGRPIGELFWPRTRGGHPHTAPASNLLLILLAAVIGGAVGAILGPVLENSLHQTLAVGGVIGLMATLAYTRFLPALPGIVQLVRFFIWPGLTMAATYFLILAYLLRIIFQVPLSPATDLALLTAACAGWMTLESLFLGLLKREAGLAEKPLERGIIPTV
ncbi:hypothetical protein [Candidatus Manganitrophus noduliformans]|uniref:Uncharacterized protein n=1 Tax=Candidatus Manganitrophus noduliformans TaxID=2606439 RepID=A0A7X6DLN9_9BACT|nr:hypothetical protein [Candidatus Manganitrophus noduliformans]NKE69422.1 hypothetical protein [Candidatus Manganitrophus noduliformans]